MDDLFLVEGSIEVNADQAKVWEILTNPAKIELYTGFNTITDWQEGSSIIFEGDYKGIKYQDKGMVLTNIPNEKLSFQFWSGMEKDPVPEENKSVITYELSSEKEGVTTLKYIRENISSLEEQAMFEEHLPSVLEIMRDVAEDTQ